MGKTLEQAYMRVLNTRTFFEDIKTPQNPYKKKVNVSIDIHSFFNDIYKIEKNDAFENILNDSYILIETIDEVNFHQPLVSMIYDARFGEQFMPTHFLDKLNRNWIYWWSYREESLKKNAPIYVFKFDFSNDDMIFKMFIQLDSSLRKIGKEAISKDFKDNCLLLKGFVKNLDDCIIMCLNEPCSKNTVIHELCHYFQEVIHIYESKDKIDVDAGIPSLQLTKNDLQYLLNDKEFYVHCYVNIFNDIKKFYYLKFSQTMQKSEYLDMLFNTIEEAEDQIFYTNLGIDYIHLMRESKSLQMLAALRHLNYKYDEIKHKIIENL